MSVYNIQAVSKLTGIGIHTLRAWESRYQAVTPERSDKGRRLYSEKDVEKLQLLAQLCMMGRSIGTVAQQTIVQLKNELELYGMEFEKRPKNESLDDESLSGIVPLEKIDKTEAMNRLLMALQFYKLDVVNHEMQKLKILLSPKELALDILSPLLREVGIRVYNETLNIAQEHALSSIIKFHMGQIIYRSYEKKLKKTKIVTLATPEGEYHEFGIMLSALLCSHYAVNFYYFGPNMPKEALVEAAKSMKSDIIILGTTEAYGGGKEIFLDQYFDYCLKKLDKHQHLWVGGSGHFNLPKFQKTARFNYISTLQFLDKYLNELV